MQPDLSGTEVIRWGILGPGRIARAFAEALREAHGADLVAVGSRDPDRAAAFAAEFGIPRAHSSYEGLAADPSVDAIYVATPHSGHAPHTLLCLAAGKHVLCEKPLALNAAQARRMIDTARTRGLVLMEAMWTRFLPAVAQVRDLVASGAIGEVRMVQADFGFRAEFAPKSRLFDPALGGGALLDLGVYPVNLAFMLCGPPVAIHATANLGSTGVDEDAAVLLRHDQGRLSLLSCSLRVESPCTARILGSGGRITIERPWWAATRITVRRNGHDDDAREYPSRGGGYTHEAEAFMDLIRTGESESPLMPLDESLAVMATLDAVRGRWGMTYPGE